MAVKKEVIEARKQQCKDKGVTVDKKVLENANDADFATALEAATPKERKPREVKIKHAKGSPHEILHTAIDTLSNTEVDYLHRHVIKPALKEEHTNPEGFEGTIYTSLRKKVLPN